MMITFIFFGALLLSAYCHPSKDDPPKQTRPHIVFILADDMGWNDGSFSGSPQIPTPHLDALFSSGLSLSRYYTSPQCTPSRASLMTGMDCARTGLQNWVITPAEKKGLPLDLKIFPQWFKELGYKTYMIGKWHLGSYRKEYAPTSRGFDEFFGFWNGGIDYYSYQHYYPQDDMLGRDLHVGEKVAEDCSGKYATQLFAEKAVDFINSHNTSKPMLIILCPNAPHTGNSYQPLQAPPKYFNELSHISDPKRRMYAATVLSLDHEIPKIVKAMDDKGMLHNSIIVFTSDNGADPEGNREGYGSNWPLRGTKTTLFEGGVKAQACITSKLLKLRKPRILNQMMHVSDWLKTLYDAAGGDMRRVRRLDGKSMWPYMLGKGPEPRKEIWLNTDPIFGLSALIKGDYKLINGSYPDVCCDGWYGPSGREELNVTSMDEWVWKDGSKVKDILKKNGLWLVEEPNEWRKGRDVNCPPPPADGSGGCNLELGPCLFNITADPCEHNNLADALPEVRDAMWKRILELSATSRKALTSPPDPRADPRCNKLWSYFHWEDPEYEANECYEAELRKKK